jgi:hypothetical protein
VALPSACISQCTRAHGRGSTAPVCFELSNLSPMSHLCLSQTEEGALGPAGRRVGRKNECCRCWVLVGPPLLGRLAAVRCAAGMVRWAAGCWSTAQPGTGSSGQQHSSTTQQQRRHDQGSNIRALPSSKGGMIAQADGDGLLQLPSCTDQAKVSNRLIIINPCKPYLSASATAPHPLGRRKAD